MAQRREFGALYGRKTPLLPMKGATRQKRQPAGTGRRSPGAFGLIPGGWHFG
jgi:hypothetical protein